MLLAILLSVAGNEPEPEPEPQCPKGFIRGKDGRCYPVNPEPEPEPEPETCENGALDWPLCSECPDGTATDPSTPCPSPEPEPEPEEECPEGFVRDPETGECVPSGGGEPEPEEGNGGGGGGRGMFTPYMARLNYQLPQIQSLVLPHHNRQTK